MSLDLRSLGANIRSLVFRLASSAEEGSASYSIGFNELSDRQKALVCLYAITTFVVDRRTCVFLDEPENFLALPEIQPWVADLRDRVEESGGQVILASHYPELIDYLADGCGLIFDRPHSGHVRVRSYSAPDNSLTPSERLARGRGPDA